MKIYIVFIIIGVIVNSCNNINDERKLVDQKEYEILLYPTGVVEDLRFSIKINDSTVIYKNHRTPDFTVDTKEIDIDTEQYESIQSIIDDLPKSISNNRNIFDVWELSVLIDDDTVYRKNSVDLYDESKDYNKLFYYLKNITDHRILLYPL